jgi:hypothetical protein
MKDARIPTKPPFTEADAEKAYDDWGANCGPAALAAILHVGLEVVRLHLRGFDAKRYTTPTMMFEALVSLGPEFQRRSTPTWPRYGLARIQWEGPWCGPGVPPAARYRYTHWVGAAQRNGGQGVFDVNCLNNGTGWVALDEWERVIVPHLAASHKRATGGWHITHAIEVGEPS